MTALVYSKVNHVYYVNVLVNSVVLRAHFVSLTLLLSSTRVLIVAWIDLFSNADLQAVIMTTSWQRVGFLLSTELLFILFDASSGLPDCNEFFYIANHELSLFISPHGFCISLITAGPLMRLPSPIIKL